MTEGPSVHPKALCESDDVGDGTSVWAFAHIMAGARVGRGCNIGDHAFIEDGAVVGDNVTVKNGVLIWAGVNIEDDVFVGPAVCFTNDLHPRSGVSKRSVEEYLMPTTVRHGASIGANATIVCGTVIGEQSLVAAGSVVTRNVLTRELVAGNPAGHRGWVCDCGSALSPDLRCVDCDRQYDQTEAGVEPAVFPG